MSILREMKSFWDDVMMPVVIFIPIACLIIFPIFLAIGYGAAIGAHWGCQP